MVIKDIVSNGFIEWIVVLVVFVIGWDYVCMFGKNEMWCVRVDRGE